MIAIILVLFDLIWLLEEMPLQLQLVLQVLLLLNLAKVQVLLDDKVDVRRRLSLSNDNICDGALIFEEVRLIFVFRLDFSL